MSKEKAFSDPEQKQTSVNADHERYEFDVTTGHDHAEFTVRWVGREVLVHAIPIETRSMPYGMIKYCIWGSGVLEWENDVWDISPGMLFWSVARHVSVLTASREQGMANFGIMVAGAQAMQQIERFLHTPIGVTAVRDPRAIEKIMIDLMEEGRSTGQHREEDCALLAQVLLRRAESLSLTRLPANALARQTFRQCREYIAVNFMRLTTLREIAQTSDITVPYLCRLFDQFYHCSAYDYLTRLKMSRAENLLLRPGSRVAEIATAVGYKDARLFARNFKVAYGKSPTEYRQAHATVVEG